MHIKIINAKYLKNYLLDIKFGTGESGILNLYPYTLKGGIFDKFKDINFFKEFYIDKDWGILCWPDNIDIAPETIYYLVTGKSDDLIDINDLTNFSEKEKLSIFQ